MSDFARLLGDLQKTAKRAASSQAGKETKGNQKTSGQKRPRTEKIDIGENGSKHRKFAPPKDADLLTVDVSFLCIGAQKAGTTWVHEMLQKCPGLSLPAQKELHFWDWHRRKGLGWYSQQFPKNEKKVLCGEVTPCYMTLPESDVREIKALFPSVRIIFLARDLVDRAWSALLMELRNSVRGMEAGQFAISDNVDARLREKMERESNPDLCADEYFMNRLLHSTHSQRNDYAAGLKRWLKYFPKEQLLVLNFDDIQKNPRQLLTNILQHIGVENVDSYVNSLEEEQLREKVNAAKGVTSNKAMRPSLRKQVEQHLRKSAQETNKLLEELGYNWRLNEYSHE